MELRKTIMLYSKFLKENKSCPFCRLKKEEIIKENKYAMMILSRARYTKDHLLIIPKRHRSKIKDLGFVEKKSIGKLVLFGLDALHKKHKNVSIAYREGNMKEVGKSISHLHIHLVPHLQIGPYNIDGRKRKIMSDKLYLKKTKELKEELKN